MAAVVAMSLLIHRRMVDASRDLPALASIGLPRAPRILGMMLCVAPLVVAGTVLAGALAVLASPLMPIGAARSAEPDPGFDTDVVAIAGGAARPRLRLAGPLHGWGMADRTAQRSGRR